MGVRNRVQISNGPISGQPTCTAQISGTQTSDRLTSAEWICVRLTCVVPTCGARG